jgi:2-polyprenyl-6-methoxyphenol hydroxylase-like FAD-dependent oxidoreductase
MRVGINGIGVAGPTLAYWLRESGHEPVLFENAPTLRTGGFLIDFWGLGYEIADRMELLPTLRERCYEMARIRMVNRDGGEQATVDLISMRARLQGRFISLTRGDLAAALFRACDGIPAHFGVSIAAIEQNGEDVLATLSNGRQERFDLVVGADGLHSHLREIAFGPAPQFERFLDCYVAAFRLAGYPHRDELTYVSHTVPRRHVGRVALRNNETLVLLICRADLISEVPSRKWPKAALRRAFGDMGWEVPEILDGLDAIDDLYFDRVSQIYMPCWTAGRAALIGDAAACPSLLAGEGTGLAMTEAYVLAGELHRAAGDLGQAFAAYEARLRAFVTAKQKAAVGFRSFFAPENALALSVRNMAMRAVAVPFFANWLWSTALRDDLELPAYQPV